MPVITVTAADPLVVFGSVGADTINVLAGFHEIHADAGNDLLDASASSSVESLFGDAGNDTLRSSAFGDPMDGGAGDDMLIGDGAYHDVSGGSNYGPFITGGTGNDTLDSGGGSYTVFYGSFGSLTPGVVVNLAAGYAIDQYGFVDTLISVHAVWGNGGNGDTIIGSLGSDTIVAYGTHAFADAGGGADYLRAGVTGSATLVGGLGSDTIYGGDGDDSLVGGAWSLTDAGVTDYLYAGNGNDQLYTGSAGVGVLVGGPGDDTLVGSTGTDYLYGGLGSDALVGGSGVENFYASVFEMGASDVDYVAGVHAGDTFGFSASLAGQVSYLRFGSTAYMYAPVLGGGYWFEGVANATVAQLQAATYFAG